MNAKMQVSPSRIKNFWVIMKIHTSDFPNDPIPESTFCYIKQGNTNLFTAFITVKKTALSKGFVEKWTGVFKASRLIYD